MGETNALPMKFDIKAEPAIFAAVYRHLGKTRLIFSWVLVGFGAVLFALGFVSKAYIPEDRYTRLYFSIGSFTILYGILCVISTKRRMKAIGTAKAKLCGDAIRYEVTDEGILLAAQDGYSFHSFSVLFKVVSYQDMWFLYFGNAVAPSVLFIIKSAFADDTSKEAFEAMLAQKLNGKPVINKSK